MLSVEERGRDDYSVERENVFMQEWLRDKGNKLWEANEKRRDINKKLTQKESL